MRTSAPFVASLLLMLAVPTALIAQESMHPGRTGPRKPLPRAEEIALARSAAPPSVSDAASVYVFTDTGYALAHRGTSGAACYVSRSWPESLEPHCFDAEGAATIMRLHMREVMLLHGGMSPDEARRTLGAEIAEGKWQLPAKPVTSYMMSAEQQLISDDGRPVGAWRPHVMIYYPWMDDPSAGGTPDLAAGIVTDPGTPFSSLMFVVPEPVKVRRPPSPR